jgi:hypothetical protein
MSINLWNKLLNTQIGGEDKCCYDTLEVEPFLEPRLVNIIENILNNSFKSVEGINLNRAGGYSGVGKAILELPSKVKYMIKIGDNKTLTPSGIKTSYDHLLSEYLANCFYHLADVVVPKMKKYIIPYKGSTYFIILSEFIDGKMYSSIRTESAENKNKIKENLLKGFFIDCILNNDDMLGHELDNVIYKDNIPYRIDTGASFCFTGGGSIQYGWNEISVSNFLNWSNVIYNDHIPERHHHIKNLQRNINEAVKNYYYKINPLPDGEFIKEPNTLMLLECFRHIYPEEELLSICKNLVECVRFNKDLFDQVFKDVYIESRKVPGRMIDHRDYFPVLVSRISNIYHFIYGEKNIL